MPSSRATARSESAAAPTSASWRPAAARISARTFDRWAGARWRWRRSSVQRAVCRSSLRNVSTALDNGIRWSTVIQTESTALELDPPTTEGTTMTTTDTTITDTTIETHRAPTPRRSHRYVEPDWFTRHVFNPMIAGLTRVGISVWGSRVLEVPGRTTGEIRTTPVNLLDRRRPQLPRRSARRDPVGQERAGGRRRSAPRGSAGHRRRVGRGRRRRQAGRPAPVPRAAGSGRSASSSTGSTRTPAMPSCSPPPPGTRCSPSSSADRHGPGAWAAGYHRTRIGPRPQQYPRQHE